MKLSQISILELVFLRKMIVFSEIMRFSAFFLRKNISVFLQLVTLLYGVHLDDLLLLGNPEFRFGWPWFRGLLYLIGLFSSLLSLNLTLLHYNDEDHWSPDRKKFSIALLSTFFCSLYR